MLNRNILTIHNISGDAYQGRINIEGQSDLEKKKTFVHLTANEIDLTKLFPPDSRTRKESITGKLSVDAALNLVHEPTLMIYGSGFLKVHESGIWKLPLLSDFFSLLHLNVGKITRLSTDLRFSGDRIDLVDLRTNGTVMSLTGKGYFWWKTTGINVVLEAALFKLGFIKTVFARQIIGTVRDYRWRTLPGKLYELFHARTPIQDPAASNQTKSKQDSPK